MVGVVVGGGKVSISVNMKYKTNSSSLQSFLERRRRLHCIIVNAKDVGIPHMMLIKFEVLGRALGKTGKNRETYEKNTYV